MASTDSKASAAAFLDKYLTPIAVLLGALIIAFALRYGDPDRPRPSAEGDAPQADVNAIADEGEPFIGNPDAPVTIAVYNDYQCPFCKQFDLEVMPRLIEKYVTPGQAKILFKDFQFLGQDSLDAAVFGRAVWEAQPDRFYPWFLAVMTAQDQGGDQGFGDLASLRELARTVPGLDVARVDQLIAQNRARYEAAANADRDEGAALGVGGTPSVIVGTELLSGLAPEAFFTAISASVDAQLAGR